MREREWIAERSTKDDRKREREPGELLGKVELMGRPLTLSCVSLSDGVR